MKTIKNMNDSSSSKLNIYVNVLLIVSCILLAVTLIPMIWIGFYAHPLGDDFYYGLPGALALRESGNPFSIFPAAIKGTIEQYKIWQGTYSAMFLMHLPPQLWSEVLYGFYPALVILLFTGSIFFVLKPFFRKENCGDLSDKPLWFIISSLISTVCIQFVPLCGETFYWFNGSFYYTGFLSLTLFMFGLIFRYRQNRKPFILVITVLLTFFIAGGNYASLLPSVLLLFLMFVNDIVSKKKKMLFSDILVIAVILVGFAISIMAPGNALRQATSYGTTPVKAVLKSLYQGVEYSIHWTVPYFFLVLILLTPIFVHMARQSAFTFRFPILLCIIVFGIFCSSECPTFYAQNNGGAARVFDICYYMMVFTLFFMYYCLLSSVVKILDKKEKKTGFAKITAFCAAGLFVICIVFSFIRKPVESFMIPNSYTAATALAKGEAVFYDTQYKQRSSMIEFANGGDAVVPAINVPARLQSFLNCGDISTDPESNWYIAEYYGLRSIKAR